ncbi:MAG: two-component system, OmpR family, sensor kinase, partial [Pseudonocardiales bacterium]|nr:two-component system, OmpR family, sensor kinase [Pseudonocardiales bacterium]
WRFLPRSLTGRLVAFVVSLVIVLVLATGIGTYYALRSFLMNRLDQQVLATANQPVRQLIGNRPYAPSPQTVWITQLSATGSVLDSAPSVGSVRHMNLSTSDRTRLAAGQARPSTVTTTDGQVLRVVSEQQPGLEGVVVIGLSTDDVERTLHRLLELELAIGASAVVIALVATAYGVRFSLRRLYRVTRTAREVAADLSPDGAGLDRRVPVAESGTEVGQLAESMNTLLAAVETQFAARLASEQRMRQFLADASHELRTPLTSIRGYAELARMQRQQGDTEPADNLARIESEGTRMSRLVDDLLTLARSDQGAQPQRELVDVAGVLDEAVTGARAAYPVRRVDLRAEPGLTVVGDRDQLLRLVRNLVTNAAVHTRPDGAISVESSRDANTVVIRVVDAGPGLPAEEAAHVFERFWRADKARSRVRGGSGLGLAIVASVVSAHGGTVHFASTVEGGSTVTVRLPLQIG